MDKFVSIIYLLGVFLLILPVFISSNNSLKAFFTNLSIWIAITLAVFSVYYFYNLYFDH